MGHINVDIDDNFEKLFRLEVVRRLGGRKGCLKKAVVEAMELWLKRECR